MRSLILVLLVTSGLLCCGCSSLPNSAQLDTWKNQTDKTLAAAANKADKAVKAAEATRLPDQRRTGGGAERPAADVDRLAGVMLAPGHVRAVAAGRDDEPFLRQPEQRVRQPFHAASM